MQEINPPNWSMKQLEELQMERREWQWSLEARL
jgi:hypothetical protein